jgi:EmrB/QacA subfamily drug resistance transporter
MIMSSVNDDRRRWLALAVVLLAFLMTVLDATVVNVALPEIQSDLGFHAQDVTWVINAYLIAYGALLLVAGRLGDLIGRKRVFMIGVVVFALSSAAAGFADGAVLLVAARFVQGIGGALAAAAVLAIVVAEFPEPADRARAMSAYMFVGVSGGSIGLLAGGLLTEAASWHWIFFINLPLAVVALAFGRLLIADDHGSRATGESVDIAGATLITAALLVAVYAIVQAPDHGWGSARTLGLFALVAVGLAAFVALERRLANPIIPPHILRVPSLLEMSAVRAITMTAMYGTFLFGVLYLQDVHGYGPVAAGAAFLPMTVTVAACSLGITRRLMAWLGTGRLLVGGLLFVIAGLGLLISAGASTPYFPTVFIAFLCFGLGMGNSFVPVLTLAMADVRREDAGLASGIVNVAGQVSAAVALAVLGTVAASRTDTLRASGHSAADALTGGYHLAYVVSIGAVVVGIVVALVALVRAGRRTRAAAAAAAEIVSA